MTGKATRMKISAKNVTWGRSLNDQPCRAILRSDKKVGIFGRLGPSFALCVNGIADVID